MTLAGPYRSCVVYKMQISRYRLYVYYVDRVPFDISTYPMHFVEFRQVVVTG